MAKKRAQQQRAPGAPRPEDKEAAEGEPEYAAEQSEIERYLESIGVKIERRGPPPARRQPPAPPPPEPEPVVLQPVEVEPYESPGDLVAEEAPPPPPRPEPPPVRIVVRRAPTPTPRPRPRPAPVEARVEPVAVEPLPAAANVVATVPSAPRPPLAVLGTRPGLSDLRRGVVLAELLRRPNFERLPVERDLF
ncbi:MAG: hypothetical protein FJ290_01665 [Planctomycetes bacterium]|nr:hypothetical protein [Planctomycetota bacterium]